MPTNANSPGLPVSFTRQMIPSSRGELFVQIGGRGGSGVVLLHGYAQSGDMWGPVAVELAKNHTVIVPDLPGLGRSSRSPDGYDKKTQAKDIRALVSNLGFDEVVMIGHDIGGMVAYAFAAQYPAKVVRLIVMEAALPGISGWEEITKLAGTWHFNFRGSDAERLVEGRERIYFDRFWNDFSGNPDCIGDAIRDHYAAQYATQGGMRAGFSQFASFGQDAKDTVDFARNMLTMPVLAMGGERADRSFSHATAVAMRAVATDVCEVIISGAGHWLIEENPEAVVPLIINFVESNSGGNNEGNRI